MTTFSEFGLPEKLLQSLKRMNFDTATPVQEQAIPVALQGTDILGSAQTGTGKTGAFAIPMIARLMESETTTALVLTPTRELATQVMAAIQQMVPVANMKTALLIGGEPMPRQFRQLQANPRIIVGTPGRVNDHLARRTMNLAKCAFLVLDETDRMLDMGFGVQLDKIMETMPRERQTMMFSATMPSDIVRMSSKYMTKPVRITVGSTTTPAANIKQEVIHTTETDKYARLIEQLDNRTGSIIVFVKTKHGTEKLAIKLNREEFSAEAINGDLQQRKRDRVIQNFRDQKFRILVATDVAARGLDIPHIEHVINFDLPQCPEDYIHRIGRTARAGAEGEAVNLLTPADKMKWNAIHRLMNPGERAPEGPRGPKAPGGKPSFGKKKPYRGGGRTDAPRGDRPQGDRPAQPWKKRAAAGGSRRDY